MIKFLIRKNAPDWVIGIAIHIKWALFIAVCWYLVRAFTFKYSADMQFLITMFFGVWFFWFVVSRIAKNPHEWKYMVAPFQRKRR